MIFIENKRKSLRKIKDKYGECVIADVTSKAKSDLIKLSPFYPHGKIPVPFSQKYFSKSVEGIWQGLKVFENCGIDMDSFKNDTGKNIKRTVSKYGVPLGHQKGIENTELLNYIDARKEIYLPTYKFMIENYCLNIINRLITASLNKAIVLLDYTTNGDIYDVKKPLSHASLIKAYCENKYDDLVFENILVEKTITYTSKVEIDHIFSILSEKPMSSKEIKERLNLEFSSRELTSILKKSSRVTVIGSSPLRFFVNRGAIELF